MDSNVPPVPDHTAVRVALWRALHLEVDATPYVLEDALGAELAAPDDGWRGRPDMNPAGTSTFRASILARSRFIEDCAIEAVERGVSQYVILGAGLDTFAQRHPELGARLRVFEVDQPATQAWKRARLLEITAGLPPWLHFVPVDFESKASWWDGLVDAGFDVGKAAVVSSSGVSMYLTKEAIAAMLRQAAALAAGSTFAMTYLLPLEMMEPQERVVFEWAQRGASGSGTPFISFFAPQQILDLARSCGFPKVRRVCADDLTRRYFADRSDGLRPGSAEEILVAST